MNRVVLSPDSLAERQFLPDVEEITGGLLLGDWGYYANPYLQALDAAGGFFIVRGKSDRNSLILQAIAPDGRKVKRFRNQPLKAVTKRLSRYEGIGVSIALVEGWRCTEAGPETMTAGHWPRRQSG